MGMFEFLIVSVGMLGWMMILAVAAVFSVNLAKSIKRCPNCGAINRQKVDNSLVGGPPGIVCRRCSAKISV